MSNLKANNSLFSCVFEMGKQAMAFAIEQGSLFFFFLCFCIFYILVNLNDNQVIEIIRSIAIPELRTCKK